MLDNKSIPSDIVPKIQEVIRFTKLGILGNEIGANKTKLSDEFVASTIQSSVKRLIGDFNIDKFISLANQNDINETPIEGSILKE